MEKRVNTKNLYKLVTKEDSTHFHKIIGVSCLINYGYRYGCYILYGHMNFVYPIDIFLLFLHVVLSVSSLIFHISNIRNPKQPMIYPEYRMHSILFALRSVGCCLVHYYDGGYKCIIIICGSTLVLADVITTYHNPDSKNGKTMRNMPFDKIIHIEDQNQITMMHSYSQIGATLFMFGNISSAFSPMFAIQMAALLMTCVRKGIIDAYMWHLIYSMTLWMNYLLFTSFTPGFFLLLLILFYVHYGVVFRYYIHKYIAWIFHFSLIIYYKEGGVEQKVNQYVQEHYVNEWNNFILGLILLTYVFILVRYRSLYLYLWN